MSVEYELLRQVQDGIGIVIGIQIFSTLIIAGLIIWASSKWKDEP